jgi:hypothetical protein
VQRVNVSGVAVRSDYTGWVGTQLTVGASPITVSSLGRFGLSGNTQFHTVKLVRAQDGNDVPGASVSVSMANATPGVFQYAALASPVTLSAYTSYYLVSYETSNADTWYDWSASVTFPSNPPPGNLSTTAVVWGLYGGPGGWATAATNGNSFGPVDLTYTQP